MKDLICKNIGNIEVSINEPFISDTLNRNFVKLVQNDDIINKTRIEQTNVLQLRGYKKGMSYRKDETVWYKLYNEDTEDVDLYILRSLYDNNTNQPVMVVEENGKTSFNESGWTDENKIGTLYNTYFKKYLSSKMYENLDILHQEDKKYHIHGQLSSIEQLSSKIMLKDLSNRDEMNTNISFPNTTHFLIPDKVITEGYYRKWDSGLIEYDINFKVGINSDGEIESNTLSIDGLENLSIDLSSDEHSDNGKYFMTESDAGIFSIPNGENFKYNGAQYKNISKLINTYSGKINFPQPFVDFSYMVFTNGVEETDNTITFVDKKRESITAIYIKPEHVSRSNEEIALDKNLVFNCQIVGRWK